jgi:hypothetical protein
MIEDPQPIDDDARLLRRVLADENQHEWHSDHGRWVPALAAVSFDNDGMSVYVREILEALGGGLADVAKPSRKGTPSVAYQVTARAVRAEGYAVTHTPDEQDDRIGRAHGSASKPTKMSDNEHRLARLRLLPLLVPVYGEVRIPPPPWA